MQVLAGIAVKEKCIETRNVGQYATTTTVHVLRRTIIIIFHDHYDGYRSFADSEQV